jgi:tetratricopeptide (TPR) repeat protein
MAFRQGRLDFDPATDLYVTTPRLDLLPKAMQAYEEAIARYAGNARHDEPLFRAAYANFLGEAITILHCYDRDAQAREIYRQALRRYPDFDQTVNYDDFINANFVAMQKNVADLPPPDAVAVVEGWLFQACLRKAAGDSAGAAEDERRARAFRDLYMQARASEDHRQRTGLPELDILRRQAERRFRTDDR